MKRYNMQVTGERKPFLMETPRGKIVLHSEAQARIEALTAERDYQIGQRWAERAAAEKTEADHADERRRRVQLQDALTMAQVRVEALEWLVEVQERFGIAVMYMGTGIELRKCALDELQESYRVARDDAGVVDEQPKNTGYQWAYSCGEAAQAALRDGDGEGK